MQAPREVKRKVSNGALQARWEDEQLSREAAVFELVTLRREVGSLQTFKTFHAWTCMCCGSLKRRVFSVSCMSALKQAAVMMWQVGHLVAELSERGELPETAEEVGLHPNVHRKLWRYVWLLDQVRSAPLM